MKFQPFNAAARFAHLVGLSGRRSRSKAPELSRQPRAPKRTSTSAPMSNWERDKLRQREEAAAARRKGTGRTLRLGSDDDDAEMYGKSPEARARRSERDRIRRIVMPHLGTAHAPLAIALATEGDMSVAEASVFIGGRRAEAPPPADSWRDAFDKVAPRPSTPRANKAKRG
jgi:hypothetical protein